MESGREIEALRGVERAPRQRFFASWFKCSLSAASSPVSRFLLEKLSFRLIFTRFQPIALDLITCGSIALLLLAGIGPLCPKVPRLPLTYRARAGAPRKAANALWWAAAASRPRLGVPAGGREGRTLLTAAKPPTPRPQAHEPTTTAAPTSRSHRRGQPPARRSRPGARGLCAPSRAGGPRREERGQARRAQPPRSGGAGGGAPEGSPKREGKGAAEQGQPKGARSRAKPEPSARAPGAAQRAPGPAGGKPPPPEPPQRRARGGTRPPSDGRGRASRGPGRSRRRGRSRGPRGERSEPPGRGSRPGPPFNAARRAAPAHTAEAPSAARGHGPSERPPSAARGGREGAAEVRQHLPGGRSMGGYYDTPPWGDT